MTGAAAIEAASGFKEAREGQRCCGRTIPGVLSFLSSLLSITYCILLSVRTAAIQERVVALEMGHKGDLYYHSSPSFSTEQLNSVVQERVDELLSQGTLDIIESSRSKRLDGNPFLRRMTMRALRADKEMYVRGICEQVTHHLWSSDPRPAYSGIEALRTSESVPWRVTVAVADGMVLTDDTAVLL
ncbi:COPA1 protein, partial [Polypterus senegalus]